MTGLYRKYSVKRVDGRDLPGGDKEKARYFVLDYVHDPYARYALAAYADNCELNITELADGIRAALRETKP